ncbi:penicillin-binding transpeptidase domain-containing protein [Halobacillus sp. A5]|uniref:penicillin-binding transpeptidase domain-containing protein n=1 Tax=Halobacillus sp. A5 TaxID=2880263 RepID=UPI0020A64A28|nr:penicillin-binding transpeptidase domain-containing protein [Halobacillus sp. A5]MCP3026330.1 penicillin-binding transpeptidase domain-containing protein [Halobacillus sp. A5]
MKYLKSLILISSFIVLVGCSDQPDPEATVENYMEAWENEEFGEMYDLLSEESQDAISQEDFEERYTNIYDGIEMDNLSVTYESPEEKQDYDEEDKPAYDYDVQMETLAGELDFSHQAELVYEEGDEEDQWAVEWNPSMIFAGMEEGDEISAQSLSSERGEIFDVNGDPLAENGSVQEVGVVPEQLEDEEEEVKEELADILNTSVEYIDTQLDQSWVQSSSFVPVGSVALEDEETIDEINELSGTQLQEADARVYPAGEAAAHIIGYVDDINAEQLEERSEEGYTASDQVGQAGLEQVLEDELRGEAGGKVAINDDEGNEKDVLAEKEATNGEDVELTLDLEVQETIYDEMDGKPGSSAALDPQTGEVRAMVSSPAYDPNEFILGVSGDRRTELQEQEGSPLSNKFSGTYSPGSTFKPITAAIGLETGEIDPDEEMSIDGKSYTKDGWGDYSVSRVDGANVDNNVNLRDALVRSDNIYFARSIIDIGGEAFLEESENFGFDEDFPFSYPISSSQILNEEEFESEALLADTGYGQGQVLMSPLHLAAAYTPFITGGDLIQPVMQSDEETEQYWKEDVISEDTASTISENLQAVVEDSEGSAYDPQVEGLSLAGKTGTAELKESLDDEDAQENGWFVAWDTSSEDLIVSMMVEDVEDGSGDVVPLVKNVFSELE